MQFRVLAAIVIAHFLSLGGAESGASCPSADVDAAARQLLQRMATSVADHLQSSEQPRDSEKGSAVTGGAADTREESPLEARAGSVREMHTTLAVAGFDFEPRPQPSSTSKIGGASSGAGATDGVRKAATAPKEVKVLASIVSAKPVAAGVRSEDAAAAEALTVDGVKRAIRGEWPAATSFFFQATEANPSKVCPGLVRTEALHYLNALSRTLP